MESGAKVINKPLKNSRIYNGEIDFWKLMFAFMIVIFHLGEFWPNRKEAFFTSGQLAVEFFFIVSGYFMMQSADAAAVRYDGVKGHSIWQENLEFILRKIKGIIPYHLFGFTVAFVAWSVDFIINPGFTLYNYCEAAVTKVWSLLLLQSSGVNNGSGINNVTWYISAMLFVMLVLYPIIRKRREVFLRYVMPIILFVLLGYISAVHKNLSSTTAFSQYLTWGVIRAFFAITAGCLVYVTANFLRKKDFSRLASIGLAALELIMFAAVFYICNKNNKSNTGIYDSQLNFVAFLFMVIAVTIVFSKKSIISPLFKSKKFKICGTMSTAVYFCHLWVRNVFIEKKYLFSYKRQLALGMMIAILCGIICILVIKLIKKNIAAAKRAILGAVAILCAAVICVGFWGAESYNNSLRTGVIAAAVKNYNEDIDEYSYIMRAGSSDDKKYKNINSLDVIRASHKEGERFFQTSICLTADGVPVLGNNWSEDEYRKKYGHTNYDSKEPVPRYKAFKGWKIYGVYSTTSFEQLADYMRECNNDMYVLITIEEKNTEKFAETCEAIVKAADNDEKVLSHIIMQANSGETLAAIMNSHNFALTNYVVKPAGNSAAIADIDSILDYCRTNGVVSVSIDKKYYTEEVAEKINKAELDCFVFTTDTGEKAKEYLDMGAELVATNYLREP